MARPRKPSNVLALHGAFKKDPARARAREAEPVPVVELGPAPETFNALEKSAYDELVRKSHPGVMCDSDSVVVQMGAVLLAKLRADTQAFTAAEFGRLQSVLASLGMTPADRSRVQVRKDAPKADPLDEFARAG